MDMRVFGRTEMLVGTLGLGAAEIGYENLSNHTLDVLIGVAMESGVNVIDTAAMYGDSEEKIGRAIRGRRNRFLIFTKCGRTPPQAPAIVRIGRKMLRPVTWLAACDHPDWHPSALQWNIDQSLRRLGTNWIDLIQLHTCSELTLRRGRVIETLLRAREAGKVRYIGFTGDGPAALYAIQ